MSSSSNDNQKEQTFHALPVIPDKDTVKNAFGSITNSGKTSSDTNSHEHNNAYDDSVKKASDSNLQAAAKAHSANPGPVMPNQSMMGAFENKASSEELKKRSEELNKE